MKQLCEYMSEYSCDRAIFLETVNLIADELITESFQSSILTSLVKTIKDAESHNAQRDKENEKRYKEEGRGYSPTKSAKSFASIFGPLTETSRYGNNKKTGIRGLKWSEIKDDDFQYFEADSTDWDKKFIKLLRSVYQKKIMADVICCKPGTKDVVCFIKGYVKTLGEVRVYYFPKNRYINGVGGYPNGVKEKTATKYKYGERSLKLDEAIDVVSGLDVYFLEIKEDMVKDYDVLHKEREESQKGVVNLDKRSLDDLLKQQQARYRAMVKEIKAQKLQSDPNILFEEIKKTNDEVVALFQKVMSKPENMDQRFSLDDLMRYVSYAYEQFYKAMKYKRDSERTKERYKKRAEEKGEEWDEEKYKKWDFDGSSSDEAIRDAKEYVQKVKKMISEIEENLK